MRLNPPSILRICLSSALLLAGLPLAANAQEPTALQTALSRCYAISEINTRVACYDDLARPGNSANTTVTATAPATLPSASAPASPATPAPTTPAVRNDPAPATAAVSPAVSPAAPAPVPAAVAGFGQQAKVETSEEGTDALVDTVTALKRVEPTKWLITLASGQVWRQTVGKTFMIREGETVRITASGWGNSFRLSVEGRSSFIQVSRAQ